MMITGDNDDITKEIFDRMVERIIDTCMFVGDCAMDWGNCLICGSKELEEINNHYLKCHSCGKVWDLRKKELLMDVEREMIERGMEVE